VAAGELSHHARLLSKERLILSFEGSGLVVSFDNLPVILRVTMGVKPVMY